jgi:hypothetical protein
MRAVILPLCLALCSVSVLPAQTDAAPDAQAARGRLAWFVTTSLPEGLENPLRVLAGQEIVEVTLSKRSPSEPVRIPPDGILRIIRETAQPAGSGEPAYQTLAHAQVPEGTRQALVILRPAPQPGARPMFSAVVQDLAKFKGGDWLFLNLTNVKVGVDMGKTSLEITPGQSRIYAAPAAAGAALMPIRYRYFHPVQEQWKMLSASTVGIVPTRREICIFSIDARYKRISYHGITFVAGD